MIIKPEDGYIACILNPKSGSGRSKQLIRRFEQYLRKKGFKVNSTIASSLHQICELATNAAVDYDCRLVVAAGGDGTVREVAEGLEGSDKPLLIMPLGTENLLANELGLDGNLKTITNTFETGIEKYLDLGSLNGKIFTSIAGFGFDGEVVSRVSKKREGHINHIDYVEPIWRTFWSYRFETIQVEVDGEKIFDGKGLVFVGNISRYAVGLNILRRADYSDGLLDICIYKCASRLHLVKHSVMTILKRHSECFDVIYRQGKNVKISSNNNTVKSEIDGDPGPPLPAEIKVMPQAVKCIVPPGSKPAGIVTRLIRAVK